MLPASAESPDRPNRVPWPPLIYLAVFAAAFLLEHFIPQLPAWPDSFFLRWLGSALVLTGIGLAILASCSSVPTDHVHPTMPLTRPRI